MYKLLFTLLTLVVGESAIASDKWAVTIERVDAKACCSRGGVQDPNVANANILISFSVGEVVHVLKQSSNKMLVGHNRSSHQAWIHRSYFVREAAFQPLVDWKGQSEFIMFSEDGGTKRVYQFLRNGTFIASENSDGDSSELFSHHKWTGHLYRYKQILWAKRKGSAGDPNDEWSVLHLEQDGTACLDSAQASQRCK